MTPEALRRKPEGLYERRKMKMEREHTKVLDFEAVRAIAAETPDSELIRWVDAALREKSSYTLPPKIHISQQDGDYYNVMPCIYERGNLAMVKMIGRHGHENRIMDLFRQDPDVHFVLCDTYEEVIAIHDLVFAANLLARAETPDTPYRCCRKKYFIRCF